MNDNYHYQPSDLWVECRIHCQTVVSENKIHNCMVRCTEPHKLFLIQQIKRIGILSIDIQRCCGHHGIYTQHKTLQNIHMERLLSRFISFIILWLLNVFTFYSIAFRRILDQFHSNCRYNAITIIPVKLDIQTPWDHLHCFS